MDVMASHSRMMSRWQFEERGDDEVFSTAAVKRAWQFARPYRKLMALNVLSLAVATGFALLHRWVTCRALSDVLLCMLLSQRSSTSLLSGDNY